MPAPATPAHTELYKQVTAFRPLGRGRFGQVYAVQTTTHGLLAVKVIARAIVDEDWMPLEAKTMEAIPAHPNVVRYFSCTCDSSWVFLGTEIVGRGTTLLQLLCTRTEWSHLPDAKKGPPQPGQCCGFSELNTWLLFRQLVAAVRHVHLYNVVHRDIKPDNVLVRAVHGVEASAPLGEQVELVLGDFGFATFQAPGATLYTFPGTFSFAAREVLMGVPYDGFKADVWSLGVCLYMMATGHFPFGREDSPKNRVRALECEWDPDRPGAPVPEAARGLLNGIFTAHPGSRFSLGEVSHHRWVATRPQE